MQPTPIKINKLSNDSTERVKPTRHVLNLNETPTKRSGGTAKKIAWFLLGALLLESGAIAWLYLQKPVSPYQKLLPPNVAASAYFNQKTLLNLIKSQYSSNPNWPPLAWGDAAIKNFLAQAKIEKPEELLAALTDPMALAILPQETANKPGWILLAALKIPSDDFSRARDKTEQALKQNFNLTTSLYRQVKISQVQSLSQNKNSFFYAQASGLFILTNNESAIKETLDRIIK